MSYLQSLGCGNIFVHNNRTRFTDGFYCEDCARFIKKGTLEHFMTEECSSIWMAVYNKHVLFSRGQSKDDISYELKDLMDRLDIDNLLGMNEWYAEEFMNEVYSILKRNGLTGEEAIITLMA